ncbi:MAG: DUF4272 domain-containing protein [Gammaproteobacteria bacterium]|nr:DUF4272 domain-containing protein [Gammaproteobacteria bacterium]
METMRKENLANLSQKGFIAADSLPVNRIDIGETTQLRSKEEIFGRLIALKALWLYVDDHPEAEPLDVIEEMIDTYDLRSFLTKGENEILNLSREEACQEHGHLMGWKNENCWPLAWILGFPDAPAVDHGQLSGDLARNLMLGWLPDNLSECQELKNKIKLRDPNEVHQLEDLFYCAHNAVRSAQLGSNTVPSDFHPIHDGGCIHERRHSLTWSLSPGIDWEETDLST